MAPKAEASPAGSKQVSNSSEPLLQGQGHALLQDSGYPAGGSPPYFSQKYSRGAEAMLAGSGRVVLRTQNGRAQSYYHVTRDRFRAILHAATGLPGVQLMLC